MGFYGMLQNPDQGAIGIVGERVMREQALEETGLIRGTVARRRAEVKALDSSALVTHLADVRKSDLKKIRRANHYKAISESHFESLLELGRGRYRAIVVSTYMSLLWDGWVSKKKTKRKPNNKVMVTRRMLSKHFNICPDTAAKAISDLVQHNDIIIVQNHVYSGKQGKNLGTQYRLPWMENASGNSLKVYWGLLISEAFLGLSVTLKATIILLHRLHSRSKNRLTVRPCALTHFGIHRNRLPGYLRELVNAGLLLYIENHDYEFSWIDGDGKPDFDRIKKISMHLTHTDPAPNSYQEVING
jgi:hypothetical protein